MKYAVKSTIYDNGKATVSKPYEVEDDTIPYSNETNRCDIYVDVFRSINEAKAFVAENS